MLLVFLCIRRLVHLPRLLLLHSVMGIVLMVVRSMVRRLVRQVLSMPLLVMVEFVVVVVVGVVMGAVRLVLVPRKTLLLLVWQVRVSSSRSSHGQGFPFIVGCSACRH